MKDSFAAPDEVIVRANDVPEVIDENPFEDDVTGEIVLLDVMRLDVADLEVVP